MGTLVQGEVRKQLTNPMISLTEKGLAADVGRVQLIMEQGATFSNKNYTVRDGYLFNLNTGKTVTLLDGFKKFILVIRL